MINFQPSTRPSTFGRSILVGLLLCAVLLSWTAHSFANDAVKKAPTWSELNAEQKQILEPLANDWDHIDAQRRAKWLRIAKQFPSLQVAEQERITSRMKDWARLTTEQRQAARERYRKIGSLPPEKRQAVLDEWLAYQQLPEHIKQRFATPNNKKAEIRSDVRKRARIAKKASPTAVTEADPYLVDPANAAINGPAATP